MVGPPNGRTLPGQSYFKFVTVPDLFLQDDPDTDPKTFDYATSNLGLIERPYPSDDDSDPQRKKTQWERFGHYVRHLEANSGANVKYKVLYMGRHGEGFHNVAEAFYGTEAWDCYWSLLDGNGSMTWADARLTEKGVGQALRANRFWEAKLRDERIPAPESFYVSPLDRCLATAKYTFSGLALRTEFVPTVKELLREALGLHTCDRRSTAAYIRAVYPHYRLEPGFAEEDPLWDAKLREPDSALRFRQRQLLEDVFKNDDSIFISLTSHSGALTQVLSVLDHRPFPLQTGGVIPALIRAETVRGRPPQFVTEPGTPAPPCEGDPSAMAWIPN